MDGTIEECFVSIIVRSDKGDANAFVDNLMEVIRIERVRHGLTSFTELQPAKLNIRALAAKSTNSEGYESQDR